MAEEFEQTKKRARSANYTPEEKATLINIISKYKNTIESKKTDKVTWKDKNDTWETITNEFNAVAPNRTYRTTDSLKKFYENMKKETRKMAAQEKMELVKTGGGKPAHKVLDPTHESILTLMNSKTVKGLNNMFDSDITLNSDSNANNTLDNMNNTIDIAMNNNESNTNTDEYIYEILDENYLKENNTHRTHDLDVNCSTNALHSKKIKKTNAILNWRTYIPDKLKAPMHTLLKINESNTFENERESSKELSKENKANISKTRRRRPSTMALNSSHISKQYSDLAVIKMELAKLQLIAQKEEMAVKQEQNRIEFELRKKSLELDIELKKAQLKRLQASSFLQQPFNIN